MTPADLARALTALPGWEWAPGMRDSESGAIVLDVDSRGVPLAWVGTRDVPSAVTGYGRPGWCADLWRDRAPDLHDPATGGILADRLPPASVVRRVPFADGRRWFVTLYDNDGRRAVEFDGRTLAIAAARALVAIGAKEADRG